MHIESLESRTLLSTVSISVLDDVIAETGRNPASFVISRDSAAGALTVKLNMIGSASAGDIDEAFIGRLVTFADGQSSQTIIVTPVDDAQSEIIETLTAQIVEAPAGSSYVIGANNTATVRIIDNDGTVGRYLLVGPGKTYATPSAAFAAAQDGDYIDIDTAGNYYNDVARILRNNLTVRGIGTGRAQMHTDGRVWGNKGIWTFDITATGLTVENCDFAGARSVDNNGAGIRAQGANLTVRNCRFYNNEDGILGGYGNTLIEYSEFANNGFSEFAHNVYIGDQAGHLVFRYNYSHDSQIGHLLKSRAATNDIRYNRFSTEQSSGSYEITLPNGGRAWIIGNIIQQGPNTGNGTMLDYGSEGLVNAVNEMYVVHNTFVNDRPNGGTFMRALGIPANFNLVARNNFFAGPGTQIQMDAGTPTVGGNASSATVSAAGFADAAAYDYRIRRASPAVGAAVAPGVDSSGASLAPIAAYRHRAAGASRSGTADSGALAAAPITYYVATNGSDTAAGSWGSPWKTIQKGLNSVAAGDTLIVRDGTYNISTALDTVAAGTSSQRITIRAENSRGAIVQGSGSTKLFNVDQPYYTFQGFVCDGNFAAYDMVQVEGAGSGLIWRDNELREGARDGIDITNPTDVLIEDSLIHDMLWWDAAQGGRVDAHGIVTSGAVRLTMRNTEIYYVSGDAWQGVWGTWDDITIEGNHWWNGPLPTARAGYPAGANPGENAIDTKVDAASPRASLAIRDNTFNGWSSSYITNAAALNLKTKVDCVVTDNRIYDSEIGMRLRGTTSGDNGAWVTATNNILYGNLKAIRYEDAINNLHLYNNTFGTNTANFQSVGGYGTSFEVYNCLFLAASKPTEASHSSNRAVTESSFVNATANDYHLVASSPAVNAGITLAAVPLDFDGVARPQGPAYDVGAYENATLDPAPVVTNVTGPAAGSYRAGQNLDLTVNYNENVTVTGAPTIGLTIGSVARNATYLSGSGGSSLLFRYTVQAGDNDADGIASVSPINLNSGSIKDSTGNNAVLIFTPPTTTGVLVDTTAPMSPVITGITTDTGTSSTDNITSDQTLVLRGMAEANATVTVTRVGVGAIGTCTANGSGVWSFDYTATTLPAGSYSFTATATDLAGNASPASAAYSVTIDTTSPASALVLSPSSPVTVDAASYAITGTAESNSLVRVYADLNNNGLIDGGDGVAGSQQLSAGATTYSISVSLTQDAANAFVVTATDTAGNQSSPADVPTITEASTPVVVGTGLKGEYFDNMDLTNLKLTRTDTAVNFNWGNGSPDALIGVDTFSARWTGQVLAPATGTYTFYTATDDGVKLWVNGQLLVNKWVDQGGTEWSGTISLLAGQKYDIKMEYYENGWGALANLKWAGPGIAKSIIPTANLFPPAPPVPDTQAPTTPGTPTLISKTDKTVSIQWAASTDNVGVTSYVIYRDGTAVGTGPATSFSDNGLTASTPYSYTVKALDSAGNVSLLSGALVVTTDAPSITGTGLKAEYFDNMDLTNLKLTRTDAQVNFNWGNGSPDSSVGADTFSVRWTGQVQAQYSQTYTFYTSSDDGVRLWVNGVQLINKWQDQGGTEWSGTIALVAGQKYDIKMEYYENGWGALAQLRWSSPSTAKQIIPQAQLFEPAPPVPDTQAPTTPGTPTLVSKTDKTVAIQWAASTDNVGVTSYVIYRDGTAVGTGPATSFSDNGLTASTPYSYTVKAVDGAGLYSAASGALAVTTDATPAFVNGLKGEYFDNKDLTNLKLTRTDSAVNFNWGDGTPSSLIGVDTFSVRWTGQVQAQYSQSYTFYTSTDDGVRLWVNGVQLINKWQDQGGTEWSGSIALVAGQKYDIRMEYYENGWGAKATLSWSSPSQIKQIVPTASLFS